eukprot:2644141-Rhodomonas_salina.1
MTVCIYPTRRPCAPRCERISTAEAQRLVAEASACEERAVFSCHPGIDAQLQLLYKRMLDGEAGMQVEIDSFLFAELLLRRHAVGARLLQLEGAGAVDLMRSPAAATPQAHTLPDLGFYIRE